MPSWRDSCLSAIAQSCGGGGGGLNKELVRIGRLARGGGLRICSWEMANKNVDANVYLLPVENSSHTRLCNKPRVPINPKINLPPPANGFSVLWPMK